MEGKNKATRSEFIRGLIRILMISALAFIAVSLGSRAMKGEQECSGCPGKGVCGGVADCSSYRKK